MSVEVSVLFDKPQFELASHLEECVRVCESVRVVSGFATVDGIAAFDDPLVKRPDKLTTFVVGAGTYRAYEALDRLISHGVRPEALFVHLGHTRRTLPDAKHRFYRYHPMLHSKVYYFEYPKGHAKAFIGSHNTTWFALGGLNGEASVLIEGDRTDQAFVAIRDHIDAAALESIAYSGDMKEAFAWWTNQFVEGLANKTADTPTDAEAKKTIVIVAELVSPNRPRPGETLYFELPRAIGSVNRLNAEVHMFAFRSLPKTPAMALNLLDFADASFWCTIQGIEQDQGAVEVLSDWRVTDTARLESVPGGTFRPTTPPDRQQIRVEVFHSVGTKYDYLFGPARRAWEPVFDENDEADMFSRRAESMVQNEQYLRKIRAFRPGPNDEDRPFFLVRGLSESLGTPRDDRELAIERLSSQGTSFIMISSRRRIRD